MEHAESPANDSPSTADDSFASRAPTEAAPDTIQTPRIEPTRLEAAVGMRMEIAGYGTGRSMREAKEETRAKRAARDAARDEEQRTSGYEANYTSYHKI